MNRPSLPTRPFLYPILDSAFSSDLSRDVSEAVRAGVSILQIRAKGLSPRDVFDLVERVAPVCREAGVRLIVNDVLDVVLLTPADGVHLGQDDFPVSEARKLLPDRLIGFSTHDREQFASALSQDIDYVAVGPVYDSTTKPGANPALGPEFVRRVRTQTNLPLVCIGGITEERIPELVAAGGDGLAVVSAIYRSGSLFDGISRLMERLQG